ncbi:RtcB family protein, partial [Pseudomonas viridiflava]
KDIDKVMHAQRELVEEMHTLRQVVCERLIADGAQDAPSAKE